MKSRIRTRIEVSPNTEGGELISDVKYEVLHVPAPEPGNIVGYEYEVEEQPLFLQDTWPNSGMDRSEKPSLGFPRARAVVRSRL
jgi:hypothetical protein